MSATSRHALVFGASGLLGWAVTNQLLSDYPSAGAFDRVTAVMNRPVSEEALYWPPEGSSKRPQLQIVSKVDLVGGEEGDLQDKLRGIDGIEGVTHVFYFVFTSIDENHIKERQVNCAAMQKVANAVNILCPSLTSFVYGGGTRGYGIYIPGGTFTPPLQEAMADNLPEDYAKTVAYPWFRELLTKASHGRRWTWSEVCPDAVVGFSPNGSGFSLALHWAQYLSLYAYNHGVCPGSKSDAVVEVPFPGNQKTYGSLSTPVSDRTLGRIAIYVALHPETCGGKIFNMGDDDKPTTFGDLWPAIANWFGLVGVPPRESQGADALLPGEYTEKHKHVFRDKGLQNALNCGVGAGSKQLDSVGAWLTFDRQLSLERLRGVGFEERRDPRAGWLDAFERLRAAGIIL